MNRVPIKAQVMNKAPAAIQITAEQLLHEATERQEELFAPPSRIITDREELNQFQFQKRKGFEDALRRNKSMVGAWIKYAQFEESQGELERARSVYERALDVDHRNVTLWLKYIEVEMKNKNAMHARNLFDRALTLLPRVDQFWLKYTYMEEMLGNVPGARQIFERWMAWEPDEHAWLAYIKLETRYKEIDRARSLFERFVQCHPYPKTWMKFAKFEDENHDVERARGVYEKSLTSIPREFWNERVFLTFAKFEARHKEFERADVIFQYGLNQLPRSESAALLAQYAPFQKQFGQVAALEDAVLNKQRFTYEETIEKNKYDYDSWISYAQLEENAGDAARAREVYERAIACVPLGIEKRFWRRYIYLWIYYAVFEELTVEDIDRSRAVYKSCLKLIPHKQFTFAKIWTLYAHFEVRQKNLVVARKTFGQALGVSPKESVFKSYIALELKLLEFERCRVLYQKFLVFRPENAYAWIKFCELEKLLQENDRCRALFELAVIQASLDMPELVWKAYIDFEIEEGDVALVRSLYERLLLRSDHVKVWISFAFFEGERDVASARSIYKRALEALKERNASDERLALLEAWKSFEQQHGDDESIELVRKRWPRRVRRRRHTETGEEEYYDYVFPDDEPAQPALKLLEAARRWKEAQDKIEQQRESNDAGVSLSIPVTNEIKDAQYDVDSPERSLLHKSHSHDDSTSENHNRKRPQISRDI